MEVWVYVSEIIRNIALAIAAGIGSWLVWRRLQPETTKAALFRREHVVELFNRAAGQLSDPNLEVRLAANYVLREVAQDFPDLANPVFELLAAHVREKSIDYQDSDPPADLLAATETLRLRIVRDENG